jgi:hypothetical protein
VEATRAERGMRRAAPTAYTYPSKPVVFFEVLVGIASDNLIHEDETLAAL